MATKIKDVISANLLAAISDLQSGPAIIHGSLTIDPDMAAIAWFLEFGTGPFHEPDAGTYTQITGHLIKPAEVEAHSAGGSAYDIATQTEPYLVYLSHGHRMRRKSTIHPGIHPMGFIRSSIFDAEVWLERDFLRLRAKINDGKRLPKRKDLVDLVNYTLEVLVGAVRLASPLDSDPDPYHADHRPHSPTLAESWGLIKAQ